MNDLREKWAESLKLIGPIIEDDEYHIWGSSPIWGNDGRVHVFAARIPVETGFDVWWATSQIAHYVADDPEGPYEFVEILLQPGRSSVDEWDCGTQHNPAVTKIDDLYVLTYHSGMGTIEDRKRPTHRIGMMTATDINGPWKKVGMILDPPSSEEVALVPQDYEGGTDNPALIKHPDGRYFLYYRIKYPGMPGENTYAVAISDNLEGPYIHHPEVVVNNPTYIEDPYVFVHDSVIYMLITDNRPGGGVWLASEDGLSFDYNEKVFTFAPVEDYYSSEKMEEGINYRCSNFERPQLLLKDGVPTHLFAPSGININGGKGTCCYLFEFEGKMKMIKAGIDVPEEAEQRTYNPMIFGGFLEHFDSQIYGGVFDPGSPLSDEKGFRLDVIDALKELKTPVIRWPGGCFVDSYHWQKGVGEEREAYGDFRWGVIEPNTFGTHEFVELCNRIGAEPYICHNGMSDPQENVDWVDYCNATEGPMAELRKKNGCHEPLNVKYWSVGNERHDKEYVDRVRDTSKAMKASDPEVQITCAGCEVDAVDNFHGIQSYLLETTGDNLDYVSIHNYWLAREKNLQHYDYLTAISKSEMPDQYMDVVINSLKESGYGRLRIAFDEWNLRAWQHPGFPRDHVDDYDDPEIRSLVEQRLKENNLASQYTMADALFSASFLNACLRHSDYVTMANIAPLVNTRGPLFVHPEGIVKRTSFHVLSMYANLLKEEVVETEVDSGSLNCGSSSVSAVDAIATVNSSGKEWSIAVINRDSANSVSCSLSLKGNSVKGHLKTTVLTGNSENEYNDIENPERVIPKVKMIDTQDGEIILPPHSLTIVEIGD